MELKVVVSKSHVFTTEEINDLIVTALEGGINNWCGKAEIVMNADKKTFAGVLPEDQSNVHFASDVIGYGGKLKLTDVEDDDEVWELTLSKMLTGIQMYCEENNVAPSDLMDDYDADTADAIVQFALFGEQVYG
jgi:hypothetical protein